MVEKKLEKLANQREEAKQFHQNALLDPKQFKQPDYFNNQSPFQSQSQNLKKDKKGKNSNSNNLDQQSSSLKINQDYGKIEWNNVDSKEGNLNPETEIFSKLKGEDNASDKNKKRKQNEQISTKNIKINESEKMFKTLQTLQVADYQNKVNSFKMRSEQNDQIQLDQMEIKYKKEQILKKWEGSGLEDDIFNEYMAPRKKNEVQPIADRNLDLPETREIPTNSQNQGKKDKIKSQIKKEPLFPKSNSSFVTFDGTIQCDQSLQFLTSSENHGFLSHQRQTKQNKIQSLSRFFQLQQTQKQIQQQQLSAFVQNSKAQVSDIKLVQTSKNQYSLFQTEPKKQSTIKSQNLSVFGQKQDQIQRQIPVVKEWFESLDLYERQLCLTTIDEQIVGYIKHMINLSKKVAKQSQVKFRMLSEVINHQNKQISKFSMVNSSAYKSDHQVADAEIELLQYVRITDTNTMHDTLTVTEDLVADPHKFYKIGEMIVGKNFLKAPHEITWLKEQMEGVPEFESCAPLWLNMQDPNSLAAWVLYFFERSLYIQWQINVHQNFIDCKDYSNQPIIVQIDNKNINLKQEFKPFWRNFCDSVQNLNESADEFLAQVKSKALTSFDLSLDFDQTSISHFHGGLEVNLNVSGAEGKKILENQIDQFIENIRQSIENNNTKEQPQIDFNNLCMNHLDDASIISQENMAKKIKEQIIMQQLSNLNQGTIKLSINMILERIFVDTFRDKINNDLKSKFKSQNKKLQKRKIKKLKQKEQQLEKERELQNVQKTQQAETQINKEDTDQHVVKLNNKDAIQMLIDGNDNPTNTWSQSQTEAIKEKKKNKRKKNKNKNKNTGQDIGEPEQKKEFDVIIEEIETDAKPIKTSTPKQIKQDIKHENYQKPDTQNYFQMLNYKYAMSLESQGQEQISSISDISGALTTNLAIEKFSRQGTIQTQSTSQESKRIKLQVPSEIQNQVEIANSNHEILSLLHNYDVAQNQGNQSIKKTEWQRSNNINGIIDELVSEQSKNSSEIYPNFDIIQVDVQDNLIVSSPKQDIKSSESSITSDKKIIQFKKRQNQRIIRREISPNSDDSSEIDSELDLLPDLHTTTLQPRDNDSSDCEQDDEIIDEEDQSSVTNSHINRQSQTKNSITYQQKQKSIGQKKSVKSANIRVKIEENKANNKEVQQNIIVPEVIKYKWKRIKKAEPLTIEYISYERTIQSEWKEQKNNKKTKKQRQLEWKKHQGQLDQSQNQQIEVAVPQFEIIKPNVTEISKDKAQVEKQAPLEQIGAKKQKGKKKDHQDAIEEFIKKIHKEEQPPVKDPQQSNNKSLSEKTKKKETNQILKSNNDQKTTEKKEKEAKDQNKVSNENLKTLKNQYQKKIKNDQNQQERISSLEEQKIMKSGYEYKAKKNQISSQPQIEKQSSNQKQKEQESEIEVEKATHLHNSASKVQKSYLNIESKEFVAKSTASIKNSEKVENEEPVVQDPPKKKKKKARSNKAKKKNQQMVNNFMIDPLIGQHLYNLSIDQNYMDESGINPIQNMIFDNPQVQDLLQSLNQQVIAQQQFEIEEFKQKQQRDAENQLIEDCQPCPEIDSDRYERFFDLLEDEMKNKIREIDQLKDSVRKERQGFIQIVENIVKQTFQNRYGNGFVGIKIFGSMATELAIETSDVDLVVTGINQTSSSNGTYKNLNKNQILKMMQKLHDNLMNLKTENKIFKIKFIDTASVPIIKLVVDLQEINQWQTENTIKNIQQEQKEEKKGEINLKEMGLEKKEIDPRIRYLKVDISIDESGEQFQKFNCTSFNHRSHSGVETIYHIQELVKQRKDLRPLVMIIKKIFDSTYLSMPYYGGISSFSLVLMVSAYLKRFDAQKLQSLSTNLSGFFHFYGVGFKADQFYLNGDSIEFLEEGQARPFDDPFIVLDPMDITNNTSHSAFRFRDIQRALVKAFKIINSSCEKYQIIQDENERKMYSPKQVLISLMSEIQQEFLFNPSHYNQF